MLISLRSKGASWIAKILFGLLILSFGFWGIPETFRHFQSVPVAATVGSTSITAEELRRTFDYNLKNLQRRTGTMPDPDLVRHLGLADKTLDSLIEPALLEAYATDLGMAVPDDLVEKAIKSAPSFRDGSGNFDPQALESYLRARGWTQAEFAASTRRDVLTYEFLHAITAGVQAPGA